MRVGSCSPTKKSDMKHELRNIISTIEACMLLCSGFTTFLPAASTFLKELFSKSRRKKRQNLKVSDFVGINFLSPRIFSEIIFFFDLLHGEFSYFSWFYSTALFKTDLFWGKVKITTGALETFRNLITFSDVFQNGLFSIISSQKVKTQHFL